MKSQVNGGKPGPIVPRVTAGEPTFSPWSLNQLTLKFRVAVVPTVTFPKSRMVSLAGVNDTALAGETVRGKHIASVAAASAAMAVFDFMIVWPGGGKVFPDCRMMGGSSTARVQPVNSHMGCTFWTSGNLFWTTDVTGP